MEQIHHIRRQFHKFFSRNKYRVCVCVSAHTGFGRGITIIETKVNERKR